MQPAGAGRAVHAMGAGAAPEQSDNRPTVTHQNTFPHPPYTKWTPIHKGEDFLPKTPTSADNCKCQAAHAPYPTLPAIVRGMQADTAAVVQQWCTRMSTRESREHSRPGVMRISCDGNRDTNRSGCLQFANTLALPQSWSVVQTGCCALHWALGLPNWRKGMSWAHGCVRP